MMEQPSTAHLFICPMRGEPYTSVICRLEDADYERHSLAMLNRIAAALHRRVEIRFLPLRGAKHSGAHKALRA